MNIDEENKAKEFYIKSDVNGIHTPRTNMVEINYLDMLKLMHSYSQEVVKNLSISGINNTEGKLQAVEDLVEFVRNNCREWNVEEMERIIDRL